MNNGGNNMLLETERKSIVKYGKKMLKQDLTTGTGGNLSILNKKKDLVAISPSGVDYNHMTPEDVVVVNQEQEIIAGEKKPSSEINMHLYVYENRPDINSVVHTHSIFATTISCLNRDLPSLNRDLPPVHYMIGVAGKKVPCAEYASFGTKKLAKNAVKSLGDEYKATLLSNHGLLCIGKDISEAFNIAAEIEFVSEIYYRTKSSGEPVIIPEEEMNYLMKAFETYGQQDSEN